MNVLKFLSLNSVLFFETKSVGQLLQLPQYLIRDWQNFIKVQDSDKFVSFSSDLIDEHIDRQKDQDFG